MINAQFEIMKSEKAGRVNRAILIVDQVAFEGDKGGYYFKATYLKEPKGEALIEISKNGEIVREFLIPGHKVWNIASHANDIVDSLENRNDSGFYVAGSDGLGGNIF